MVPFPVLGCCSSDWSSVHEHSSWNVNRQPLKIACYECRWWQISLFFFYFQRRWGGSDVKLPYQQLFIQIILMPHECAVKINTFGATSVNYFHLHTSLWYLEGLAQPWLHPHRCSLLFRLIWLGLSELCGRVQTWLTCLSCSFYDFNLY